MVRFAIRQGEKWRVIDNAKQSQHNSAAEMFERIHTTSFDVALAITSRMKRYMNDNGVSCRMARATRDMKSAYRQISRWKGHRAFHIVAVFHPVRKEWLFAELFGLAFGLALAVLQFNRVPIFISTCARRWLGIPCVSFFDDMRIQAPFHCADKVWINFNKLLELLGWTFDPEKDQLMNEAGEFLGIKEDLCDIPSLGIVSMGPKDLFFSKLVSSLNLALETGSLSSGDAASLRGKLLHLSQALEGRIGRGQLFSFQAFIDQGGGVLTPAMIRHLSFHKALLEIKPFRKVDITFGFRKRITIYTDASCAVEPPKVLPTVRLCYMMFCGGTSWGGKSVLSDNMLLSMQTKKTFIAHGEALAILWAIFHESKHLSNSSIVWFVDNLGVLSCLCKGSSTVADISCIIHAILLSIAACRAMTWWEHVDSAANAADGGTRMSSEVSDALGILLRDLPLPPWPPNTLEASADVWLKWLASPAVKDCSFSW